MEYNELVNGFAAKFAIEGLEILDGAAALEIDGMPVAFKHDEAADAILVVAEIGVPPPDPDGPFGSMMLQANYGFGGTGGAVLCQNPETGAYAVTQSFPLLENDSETFARAVETLVNTADRWRNLLNGVREAEKSAEDADNAPSSAESAPPFPPGAFIPV